MDRATRTPSTPADNAFGYECPTADDVKHELSRLVSADEAARIWEAACASIDVHPRRRLTIDHLLQIAAWLKDQAGMAKIVGNSLSIRLRSYQSITDSA